ncbi:shikimate dehydrogenase [archaeon]|nr:shikimate dehydrogenase [archaeon]
MTRICIPIVAETIDNFIKDIKKAEILSDLIELRIDYIKDFKIDKLEKLIKNCTKDFIITCRPKNNGGKFEGNEKERISILEKAIDLECPFIDLEIETENKTILNLINKKQKTKIILSYHDFKKTNSLKKLKIKYDEMNSYFPDFLKIVTYANSINDNFNIFSLLNEKSNLISFCMGIRGHISRILTAKYGSYISYVCLEEGKESADGQISAKYIEDVYNFSSINKETKVLGVLGSVAENSKSKFMHNANFKKKKLNFIYIPFKVRKEELKELIKNFKIFEFRGGAVTIPHKEDIMQYFNNIDNTAKIIGATNTFVNDNSIFSGHNTDYYGAEHALKEITKLKDKKILVIGAGGAARSLCYVLNKEKSNFTIINRTYEKAKLLADEFNGSCSKFKELKKEINNNDIIINTTSVGMNPNNNECIIEEKIFPKNKIIMDMVYNPIETVLIKLANKNNCTIITGDRMLAYQAIGQFKLWTGVDPYFDLMQKALLEHLDE